MLMTVRAILVQHLILPDRHWPYFLVTLLAMALAAGLGYVYDRYLGPLTGPYLDAYHL